MISFKPVRDNPKNYTLKLWGLQAVNIAAYNGYDPFILHEWQSCSSPRGLVGQIMRSIGESNPNPMIDSHVY